MLRITRARFTFGFAFLIGLVLSSTAWPSRLELTGDNDTDLLVPGAATTDRNYTQGSRLAWSAEPDVLPAWGARILEHLPGLAGGAATGGPRQSAFGLAIGQEIYTPDAISRVTPEVNDRPYAGWLYASAIVTASEARHERSFETTLGVVGPDARADLAQEWWHRSLGIRAPRGWAHQLRNEPTLGLRLEDRWRAAQLGHHAELIPHAGATVGNVRTDAFAGVTARLATTLPPDFGPSRLLPMPAAAAPVHAWVFARAEGRAVARDIFLDGNTFVSGPHVTRIPLVGEAQLGFGLRTGRLGLRYQFSYTTQQFRERSDSHEYGSIAISF